MSNNNSNNKQLFNINKMPMCKNNNELLGCRQPNPRAKSWRLMWVFKDFFKRQRCKPELGWVSLLALWRHASPGFYR